jgi:hypothetical protein
MIQKNGARFDGAIIIALVLLISCTGDLTAKKEASLFNGAGRIVSVDSVKDEIYLDTTNDHERSANVYVKNALEKVVSIPHKGDTMLFRHDSPSNKIDTFKIIKKQ